MPDKAETTKEEVSKANAEAEALLARIRKRTSGRPKGTTKDRIALTKESAEASLSTTVRFNTADYNKLRIIAIRENTSLRSIIDCSVEYFIRQYEKLHGEVTLDMVEGRRDAKNILKGLGE